MWRVASALVVALAAACGPPTISVVTVQVEVETLTPATCGGAATFDDEACARGEQQLVLDDACVRRDVENGEPVDALVDPQLVKGLVQLDYQGPDQVLRSGGDTPPVPTATGSRLLDVPGETVDIQAAHDVSLVLYSVDLDGELPIGAPDTFVSKDGRVLTFRYTDGEAQVEERHTVGEVAEKPVQLEDGRFVAQNFCGCGSTGGAPASSLALALALAGVPRRRRRCGR